MGGIYALTLLITAVAALLSIPLFYLWAWAMGPAVRYLARRAAEGWFEVAERRQHHAALQLIAQRASPAPTKSPITSQPAPTAPEHETPGRTPDAGHRWLDDTH